MTEKLGIEETLDVLESGAKLSILVKELSDGVDIGDLDEAINFVTTLPAAVTGIKEVKDEIEDLDDEERKRIDIVLDKYNIPEGKKKAAFKHFVQAGLHAGQGALLLMDDSEG
jgi:hypothetical protein